MLSPTGKRRGSFIGNQTDAKQEEKFDYTDSEFDLTVDKQSSQSPLKFHDFMDRLVGKNKLLAQAEQYDKARGVIIPKNDSSFENENNVQDSKSEGRVQVDSPILKEQDLNKASESNLSERRITSVEYPKLNKQMQFHDSAAQVSAMPYMPNPKGTTIEEHLLVQSTPLSKIKQHNVNGKNSSTSQPKDLLKEKFQDSRKQSLNDHDPPTTTELKTTELRDELTKFKEELDGINRVRNEQEQELRVLKDSSNKKDKELAQLKREYNDLINSVDEAKIRAQKTEKEFQTKIQNLTDELLKKEKSHTVTVKKLKAELKSTKELQAGLVEKASMQKLQEDMEERLNSLSDVVKSRDSTINDLTAKLKSADAEQEQLSLQLLESKTLVEQLNSKLESKLTVEAEVSDLKSKLATANNENSVLLQYIANFTLFKVKVGEFLISQIGRKKSQETCEKWLKSQHIIGYKTENEEESFTSLKNLVERDLKPTLEEKSSRISYLEKEVGDKNSKITELLDKVTDVQQSREELISLRDQLTSEVTSLKSQICSSEITAKENAFKDLTEQNLKLLEKMNVVNDEVATILMKLKTESASLQKEKELSANMKSTISHLESSLSKIRKSYEKVKGNAADKITPDTLMKIHTHMNKESYENLELDTIDNLNLVECQNTIKNIVAILNISYSKLSSKLPLVNIMLRYEKTMLFHFANKVHNLLFHQEIDFKTFTKKALENYWTHRNAKEIQHPLEQCLKDLYKSVSEKLLV